jgi:ElaB/YqjD/DUF883 family membrane-anchored ribosome-binding protein
MTQLQKTEGLQPKTKSKPTDPLDGIRSAVQQLNGAISDALAIRGEKATEEMHAISQKTKAVVSSLQDSFAGQGEAIKTLLGEAKTFAESTEKQIAAGLKSTGREAETSFRQALGNARAAAQKISEAVATKRTAQPSPSKT